jgi:hypothetical protein
LKELKTKQHQVIDSFLSDCLVPECYFCSWLSGIPDVGWDILVYVIVSCVVIGM